MLQINQSIADKITHSIAASGHSLPFDIRGALSESDYQALGQLAHHKQWILYTAECPRPDYEKLANHDINCRSVVQMKPSAQFSEKEIIVKAIDAGTACAIVASEQFSIADKAELTAYASQMECYLFFINSSCSGEYTRH